MGGGEWETAQHRVRLITKWRSDERWRDAGLGWPTKEVWHVRGEHREWCGAFQTSRHGVPHGADKLCGGRQEVVSGNGLRFTEWSEGGRSAALP